MKRENKVIHPFSSDRPISSRKEDLLGRARFSEKLAEAASKWREKDSLILAVNGRWGEGKSSVKNMALECLNELPKDSRPQIVEFNPWQWADQTQLLQAFFNEIFLALGKGDESKEAKESAQRWKEYAAYLQLTKTTSESLRSFIETFLAISGFGAFLIGIFLPNWMVPALKYVGAGLLLFIGILKIIEKFVGPIVHLKELKLNKTNKTLEELKNAVKDSLTSLKNPIVIVMDDLDRLRKPEIKELVQVIKANGDFPNLIYFLFFQRDIVEKCLGEPDVYKGSEYLEKIVQVSFDIPKCQEDRVHKVLFAALDKILESEKLEKYFDSNRWQEIFSRGLGHYFKNLRDVYRFISTFSFHVEVFKIDGTFQVNTIDLIALETLRQFEPKVYEAIYANKTLFTGNAPNERAEAKKKEITNIIEMASLDKGALQRILQVMFPNIRWAFSTYHSSVSDTDYVNLRICHPNIFDKYFALDIPPGEISQVDVELALQKAGNKEEFKLHLLDLKRRGLLGVFLDRFEAYKEKVPIDLAVPFVTALFDIGDELSEDRFGVFGIGETTHARRIILWFLRTETDIEKRKTYLLRALQETSGTFLPLDWIRGELNEQERDKYPDAYIFNKEEHEKLKEIGRQIVSRASNNKFLNSSMHLMQILYTWLGIDDEKNVKDWVAKFIETDDGLLSFLERFVTKGFISSGYSTTITWNLRPETVSAFADFDTIVARLGKIDKEKLSDEGKRAVKATLEANDRLKNPSKYPDWRR